MSGSGECVEASLENDPTFDGMAALDGTQSVDVGLYFCVTQTERERERVLIERIAAIWRNHIYIYYVWIYTKQ